MSSHFKSGHHASSHFKSSHFGVLQQIILAFTPGGGLDDGLLRLKKRIHDRTKKNIKNFLAVVSIVLTIEENDGE